MKYLYIFIISLLFCNIGHANDTSETWIGYVPICYHLNRNSDLNEINHGIFVFHDTWVIGTFKNSSYIQSYFLGKSFNTKKWTPFENVFLRLNAHIGLLYGYGDYLPDIEGWSLGFTPTLEIGYKSISIETMISPADDGVISFVFKYRF